METLMITYNGKEFDVCIEGEDVVLQSPEYDIVIEGGYSDLKQKAIKVCQFPVQGEDGLEFDWNPDSVEEEVRVNLVAFANTYAYDGTVIKHA